MDNRSLGFTCSSFKRPLERFRMLSGQRRSRRISGWLLVAGLVALNACASSPQRATQGPIVFTSDGADRAALAREVPADLLRMFDRLQELVLARDDQAARHVLARIYARRLEGNALEFANGFDRVLKGRAYVSAIRLELVTQAHETDPERYRVALFVVNESAVPFSLLPGVATLTLEQTVVDGLGHERRNQTSSTTEALPDLLLVPNEPVEFALQEFSPPVGMTSGSGGKANEALNRILAARYDWHLTLLSSAVQVEEVEYPAMRFNIASAERSWISRELPKETVSSETFATEASATRLSSLELLSLVVRVPAAERDATLTLIGSNAGQLGLDRLRALAPSLRWLSGDSRLGDDPASWRAWLARHVSQASEAARGDSSLDLPSPR